MDRGRSMADQWEARDQSHLERRVFQASLPAGEEVIPDTPADAIGDYVTLLLRREDLATRQADYEREWARLHATGEKVRVAWDALEAERLACVEMLQGLPLSAEEILTRTWAVLKGHQAMVGQETPRRQAHPALGPSQAQRQAMEHRRMVERRL